jgi:hypothetical protein
MNMRNPPWSLHIPSSSRPSLLRGKKNLPECGGEGFCRRALRGESRIFPEKAGLGKFGGVGKKYPHLFQTVSDIFRHCADIKQIGKEFLP